MPQLGRWPITSALWLASLLLAFFVGVFGGGPVAMPNSQGRNAPRSGSRRKSATSSSSLIR